MMDGYYNILLATFVAVLVSYVLFFKTNYFKEHKIPYLRSYPFIGNNLSLLLCRESFTDLICKIYNSNQSAKYVGFYDFNQYPVLVIRDLELIKTIGVKHFDHFVNRRAFTDPNDNSLMSNNLVGLRGDRWKAVRNLLTPAFTSSKMKAMFKLMSECARNFSNSVEGKLEAGVTEFNSKDIFTRYTNDAIATCAFGISVDSMEHPNNEFYMMGKKATNMAGLQMLKFMAVRSFPRLAKLLNIKLFSTEIEEFFYRLIRETIATRDENNITRPDMIQLMMEARGENSVFKGTDLLSIEMMTAQAFIFFFGGFDTTSTLMCFAAHAIAIHSEVQTRLQEEIDSVLEKYNGEATYEAVNGMQYLDAVVNESLRLYPIGAFIDRICTKATELPPSLPGGDALRLEPGANIWFPVWAIHRDPQYFRNPEVFDPERFLGEERESLNMSAYIPFGIGPRMCIGNRFALLETKVMLIYLLSKFTFQPGEKMILPMKLMKSFIISAEGGFWLKLISRQN